jgi:hypothetical protein
MVMGLLGNGVGVLCPKALKQSAQAKESRQTPEKVIGERSVGISKSFKSSGFAFLDPMFGSKKDHGSIGFNKKGEVF